ncbi:uncharacterized protein I303_100660 [Kwoniella dejecticola CBS 10117]|uniref:Uncharacterized protein n=1 Tax=Kwoniella dejecticola CBS 10117 TaxID=1296121 RepID=A0A1A6AFJ4_9TREE|nr:uncharacterized protein I303_00664 [Kwoniella dejecticola CBS 10117]OBR88847.1 hypothetical protein I303_00664 [Kwoniella dejecticola CBS 10117]
MQVAVGLVLSSPRQFSDIKPRNTPDLSLATDAASPSIASIQRTCSSSPPLTTMSLPASMAPPVATESTVTELSTSWVDQFPSTATTIVTETTIVPPSSSAPSEWETAPSSTESLTTNSETATRASLDTSSTANADVNAVETSGTFFGVLTYELGQHVLMYDVTANKTPYRSYAKDDKSYTKYPVTLVTDKSNTSKRSFEFFSPAKDGSWGPEVDGSECQRKLECEITFSSDPEAGKNRPSFAVWNSEPYWRIIDPQNRVNGTNAVPSVCRLVDC